ncbi:MAG: hypothetical protein JWO13_1643 [Acidobacteriales bacterium]|nr:hypothetical protein [Terriglobales bacterium]
MRTQGNIWLILFALLTTSTSFYVWFLYQIGALFDAHTGIGGIPAILVLYSLSLLFFLFWRRAIKSSTEEFQKLLP